MGLMLKASIRSVQSMIPSSPFFASYELYRQSCPTRFIAHFNDRRPTTCTGSAPVATLIDDVVVCRRAATRRDLGSRCDEVLWRMIFLLPVHAKTARKRRGCGPPCVFRATLEAASARTGQAVSSGSPVNGRDACVYRQPVLERGV